MTSTPNNPIHANETNRTPFQLSGHIYSYSDFEVSAKITTGVLHNFADEVEEDVAKMFLFDPSDNKEIRTMTIGCIWDARKIVVILRIWLYKATKTGNVRQFQDSYFYIRHYDEKLRPIDKGRLLGIPAPVTGANTFGPEDPRLVSVGSDLIVVFSMCDQWKANENPHIGFYGWNVKTATLLRPSIANHTMLSREKNWSPLVYGGVLHFVYTLTPLRVAKCNNKLRCHFVFKEKVMAHRRRSLDLRGGTPFEKYSGPYYISVAHTGRKVNRTLIYVHGHIVLMRVDQWRVVYVSDVIRIDHGVLKNSWHPFWTSKSFIYPTGLLIESDDVITIGVSVGDGMSHMIRIRGLKNLLKKVIDADQNVEVPHNSTSIRKYLYGIVEREMKYNVEIYSNETISQINV